MALLDRAASLARSSGPALRNWPNEWEGLNLSNRLLVHYFS